MFNSDASANRASRRQAPRAEVRRLRRAAVLLSVGLGIAACKPAEGDDEVPTDDGSADGPLEFARREFSLASGEVKSLQISACCAWTTNGIDFPELCAEGPVQLQAFTYEPYTLLLTTEVVGAMPPGLVELVVRVDQPGLATRSHSSGLIGVPTDVNVETPAEFFGPETFPCESPMEVSFLRTDDADTTVDLSFVIFAEDGHSVGFDGVEIAP